jgi:protocatechuate 3,4-dioxygenase beta subunit
MRRVLSVNPRPGASQGRSRTCRFEQIEPRRLLSADPIRLGAVYFEEATGLDEAGDLIEIAFLGGAPGTQLTELVVETDKLGDGLSIGDVFFDAAPGGGGAFGHVDLSIIDQTGIDSVVPKVLDGGTTLSITFAGFDPGERLLLTIDVDEQGFIGANAVAEGNEFEGSILTASFAADHFFDADASDIFFDYYDGNFAGSGLDLPPDRYVPPSEVPRPVHTAGAFLSLTQTPLPITIAGTVYDDVDLDNVREPGEPGLAGVSLALFRLEDGRYEATGQSAVTDVGGRYRFEHVLPGVYRIVETQPGGYFSVGATAGTVAGDPRGTVTNVNTLSGISLLGGEDSVDNDFAEARPAELHGNVYHDADNDGLLDPDESGIGNVLIRVWRLPTLRSQPAPVETRTLSDGSWSVAGLIPGDYRIEEVQPGGYFDGLDAPGTAGGTAHNPGDVIDGVRLESGQVGRAYHFGELVPSRIGGRVIADRNGNCTHDPGEPLLAGVTVYLLDAAGSRLATTQTDAEGEYLFTDLGPGVYGVEEVQPNEYFDGPDLVGSEGGKLQPPDSITAVTLVSATAAVGYDFCELEPASLSGFVYVDENNSAQKDLNEPGIEGVELMLLDAKGNATGTTVTTDASGFYRFDGLKPEETYGVAQTQPAGFYDGLDAAGTAGGAAHNPGDSLTGVYLPPAVDARDYNFGELRAASLSGFVYVDDNNNAQKDPYEPGIGGVALMLLDAERNATGTMVTTDTSGFYRFDGLKPEETYGVAETQPAGFYDGLDAAGTAGGAAHNPGDSLTGVYLPPAVDARNYNFGELRPASIGGRVYAERNVNGMLDPGEPLLSGVTVYLLDAWGNRITSTLTDAKGEYLFDNLRPGTYGVEEIQPDGYIDGRDWVGSAGGKLQAPDSVLGAKLISGTEAVEYDFSEVVPASISGYVFQDGPAIEVVPLEPAPEPLDGRDGKRTADDRPIAGVTLRLGDVTGELVHDADGNPCVAVTNAAGYYEFNNLEPGLYVILETHPAGYVDGIDTPGSHGGVAVNPGEPIDPGVLLPLTVDPRYDAILSVRLNSGDEAVSYNFSEVLVVEMPFPIPPDPTPWSELPTLTPPPESPQPVVPIRYLPAPEIELFPGFVGGTEGAAHTWHLSVINAGYPRGESGGTRTLTTVDSPLFNPVSWRGADVSRSQWILADEEGRPAVEFRFGLEGALPVTGDFDGDGLDEIACFLHGVWFIDLNGNGVWDDDDLWAWLGSQTDLPVTGDWDGDGKDDIGVFGPAWMGDARAIAAEPGLPDGQNEPTGRHKNLPPDPQEATVDRRTMKRAADGHLREDLIDHVFHFGRPNDVPVAGDFNGDGVTNVGLFRDGSWYLDVDGSGQWSAADVYVGQLGAKGDVPVVGDFNGDGVDDLGVYRDGLWRLDSDGDRTLTARDKVFELGGPNDRPVVGDFNGDGVDEIGIYRDAPAPNQQTSRPTDAPAGDVAAGE